MARRNSRMFGAAQSGDLSPVWGVATSGALGTGTAIGLRAMTTMDKHAELVGMGVGVAAGAALMLSRKSRAAGFTGIVTALVTGGLRYAEAMVSAKQQLKDIAGALATQQAKAGVPLSTQLDAAKATAKAAGLGIVSAQQVPTLGAISAQRIPMLGAVSAQQVPTLGGGLGIVSPEVLRQINGAGGGFGSAPVTFQGQGRSPVNIVGAGGIASAFGATVFGGG